MRSMCAVLLLGLLGSPGLGQTSARNVKTATQMLTQAEATANKQHKNVMLVFTASWCGPCHLLQNLLTDPAIRPIFDRHFVKVTVFHAEHVRRLDTPGADQLLDSLHDTDTSIPFIAILGGNGKLIVDSVRPVYGRGRDIEANIGFPDDTNSQMWFFEMLRRGAPSLTSSETQTIRNWLFQHTGSERPGPISKR